MAIPKIIHYAWFSDQPMDSIYKKCFASWEKVLPGYKLHLWNGQHTVSSSFFNKMIRQQKWAFASDYIRLYALYHYGGIYLDLDVRVIKSFDPLLHHPCVLGREDAGSLACHFMAAQKGHGFIKECLDTYDNALRLKISPPPTMPRIISKTARAYGLSERDEKQGLADDITIYPSKYFSPFHFQELRNKNPDQYISEDSYCIHYWHHGWSWLNLDIISYLKNQPWFYMNIDDWKRFIMQIKKKFL